MLKRLKQLLPVLLLVCFVPALSGLEPLPPCNPLVISSSGLTTLAADPAFTYANPIAGNGGISTSTAFINSMRQLNQYEVASILSYQGNSMYVAWQALDNDDYTRQDISFGVRYSYRFFRLGLGYKLLYDQIPGYGSEKDDRLTTGIRLTYKQTTLDLGSENRLTDETAEPSGYCDYSIVLGQELPNDLALAAGFTSERDDETHLKLGCRYRISPNLQCLTSWSSNPGRFGVGASFNLKALRLSYALQTHPELDWTHSLGISVVFP